MPIVSAGANSITVNTTSSLTTQLSQQVTLLQALLLAQTVANNALTRLVNGNSSSLLNDPDPLLAQDLITLATTDKVTVPSSLS